MICPKCGKNLPEVGLFCTECGTSLKKETIVQPNINEQSLENSVNVFEKLTELENQEMVKNNVESVNENVAPIKLDEDVQAFYSYINEENASK